MLARRARGRVLDLGGSEAHRSLFGRDGVDVVRAEGTNDDLLGRLADSHERFDTIFSVFRLTAATDLDATLSQLIDLLADDGILLFLEPGPMVGLAGRAQRLAAPVVALSTGWFIDRDIPAELRGAGLSVTDLERHRAGTVQWWLRRIVEGSAHRALTTPGA